MELRVFRDWGGFELLQPHWDQLLERSMCNTVFLTWDWQTTWWRCLGEGEVWLLAWYEAEVPVAIASLERRTLEGGARLLSLAGGVYVSDYLDLIVTAGQEERAYSALLDWLTGPGDPEWDLLQLPNLAESSPTQRVLPGLATARGLEAVTVPEEVCPVVELPGSYDQYLRGTLSKDFSRILRRKTRRIQEQAGARWYSVRDPSSLDEAMSSFLELVGQSGPKKRDFLTPQMRTFLQDVGRALGRRGMLNLAFLEVEGRRVAAIFGIEYLGRLFAYNSGFDPTYLPHLSPGIALTAWVIRDAIERGLEAVDFLRGNEGYKHRLGAKDVPVYTTRVWRPDAV